MNSYVTEPLIDTTEASQHLLLYTFHVVIYAFVLHCSIAKWDACQFFLFFFSGNLVWMHPILHQYLTWIYFCFIQATGLAGLLHLVKFYKSHRFDADIGMPRSRSALCITFFPSQQLSRIIILSLQLRLIKYHFRFIDRPNDFHDIPEYFVLEVML